MRCYLLIFCSNICLLLRRAYRDIYYGFPHFLQTNFGTDFYLRRVHGCYLPNLYLLANFDALPCRVWSYLSVFSGTLYDSTSKRMTTLFQGFLYSSVSNIDLSKLPFLSTLGGGIRRHTLKPTDYNMRPKLFPSFPLSLFSHLFVDC
jgi:hypothetical protein